MLTILIPCRMQIFCAFFFYGGILYGLNNFVSTLRKEFGMETYNAVSPNLSHDLQPRERAI